MKRLNLIAGRLKEGRANLKAAGPLSFKGAGFRLVIALCIFYAAAVLPQFLLVKPCRFKLDAARNKLQAVKLQLSRLQTQTLDLSKERQALLKKRNLAGEDLEYFRSAKKDRYYQPSEVLQELAAFIPPDIRINKLSIGPEQIAISGLTEDDRAVSDFMARLKESGRFKAPVFNSIQKGADKDSVFYSFEITTHFVSGGAVAN